MIGRAPMMPPPSFVPAPLPVQQPMQQLPTQLPGNPMSQNAPRGNEAIPVAALPTPPRPVIRMQSPEDAAPPSKPVAPPAPPAQVVALRLPTPEQLGVQPARPPVTEASDWASSYSRLEKLGATCFHQDRLADGRVANRRDFGTIQGGGNGDGMAIDAAGRLYVTTGSGVQVFGPDGSDLGLIPTPRAVISVAFSGPDKKTLYVVGSGALDPDGREHSEPAGRRNNAKTIFKLPLLAQGFSGRAK